MPSMTEPPGSDGFALRKNVRAWVLSGGGARTASYFLAKGTPVRPVEPPAEIPHLTCEVRVVIGGRERRVWIQARDFLPRDLLALVEARHQEERQRQEAFYRRWHGLDPEAPQE